MKKQYFFLILLLLFSLGLWAQNYTNLIAKAGDSKDYPKSAVLGIFDSTRVEMQESGLSYYYMHKLTKVLTHTGAKQLRVVKLGYDPLSAYVEIQKVVLYKKSGEVIEIENPILDYAAPARAIYWGAREKMMEVGRLVPGDAVEVVSFKKGYTYALLADEEEKYIPPMRGHFYDIVPFWSKHAIQEKVYQLRTPKDKNLQFEVYYGELSAINQSEDATFKYYSFSKEDITPAKSEPNMVSKNNVNTKLLMSTSPDWYAKGKWFYKVNEDYGAFDPTLRVTRFVSYLIRNAENELDSISILTHWVADNMRYSGISIGTGEGYTLHNCEMNFADRCGVCKDKASLLISMLRAAGFESYAAMTMAGERIEDIPADQFNHSITVVKMRNGEWKLLDPTWVPGVRELWSSAEQQQGYLMGLPDGSDLQYTPISPPENHYVRMKANSVIDEQGNLKGSITITAEGQSDAAVRGVFRYSVRTEWRKNVEKELLKLNPAAQITNVEYTDNDKYLEQPVSISYEYTIPNFALVTPEEIIFTPALAQGIFKRAMSHLYLKTTAEEKEFGFKDRCSRLVEMEETISLPAYKEALALPVVEQVDSPYVKYQAGYSLKDQELSFVQNASYGKRVYEAKEWPDYRKAVKLQKEMETKKIILKK
ncbi:MAG: transglutaminase [Bacteroidetes bacterium 4572_77]|nr:MAG: transglutaminase [Bacteroidetes bacterium 4572_77]